MYFKASVIEDDVKKNKVLYLMNVAVLYFIRQHEPNTIIDIADVVYRAKLPWFNVLLD